MRPVALIPYVCGAGAQRLGCEQGPSYCKKHNLQNHLKNASWFADPDALYRMDHGKKSHDRVPPLGSLERRALVLRHCERLRDHVAAAVKEGSLPVVIGGDHSMAAASMGGLVKAEGGRTGLVWIDAHPDLNTWETTPSNSIHGMPVAAMLGMGDEDMRALAGKEPMIRSEDVFYLGIRSIDPPERWAIAEFNIWNCTMDHLNMIGFQKAFSHALEKASSQTDHLVLSIDLDSLDPEDTPSVGSPVSGGLRKSDLIPVLREASRRHRFDLIEIAEFNPTLPGAEKTYGVLCEILESLINP